jgi:hypothetical protein
LLEIVPETFDFDTKLTLYRQLRDAHLKRENIKIRVKLPVEDGFDSIASEAWRIVNRARSQPLPTLVDARLTCLSQGDGLLARKLVAAVELEEGSQTATHLRKELTELASLLHGTSEPARTHHTIELPCGTINVQFTTKKKWSWLVTKKPTQSKEMSLAYTNEQALAQPVGDILTRLFVRAAPRRSLLPLGVRL